MTSYCKTTSLPLKSAVVSHDLTVTGYALPGVLIVSTMTSLLVLIIIQLSRDLVFLVRDTKEILLERSRPTLPPQLYRDTSECISFTPSPVTRLLCVTVPRIFKSYPKIPSRDLRRFIEFNSLFSQPNTCHQPIQANSSGQGRLPMSPLTCNVREYGSERIILRENLLSKKITLLPTSNRSAALLASLGDITVENELILSTDSVIVAAGSIRIKGIFSNDTNHRKITLIANSGDVSVDQVSPAVFPLVFGRAALSIPSVRLNPPYPMVVEKERSHISGIMLIPETAGK